MVWTVEQEKSSRKEAYKKPCMEIKYEKQIPMCDFGNCQNYMHNLLLK